MMDRNFADQETRRALPAGGGARQVQAGIAVVAAALAALGVAYFAEFGLRLVPCPLCLLERWPYCIVAGLGFIAALLPARAAKTVLGFAALVMLAGAAIAFVHVGVERGWWPSPLPECNAPPPSFGSDLPLRPSISCAAPAYMIPGLPVSMALMDMIYALAFALMLIIYVLRNERKMP